MEMRQQEQAANATINRELEGLQRAFTLAKEYQMLTYVPYFKSLSEDNARQGFLDRAGFDAILSRLTVRGKPDTDLQEYMAWCFFTGMRTGETKALTWADFDRETWTIRLHAKDSKNRKGRAIPLENELRDVIERRMKPRQMDCPYIFHRKEHYPSWREARAELNELPLTAETWKGTS